MIAPITSAHHTKILKLNTAFEHLLSPLTAEDLVNLLSLATYKKQIAEAEAVLIGYGHDVDYDHKNLQWLRARFDQFYYIDRVIIDAQAHGKGHAKALYLDFEAEARRLGIKRLVCEVNTRPDNPASHRFHLKMGFNAIGEETYPDYNKAVRYYEKPLLDEN